MVRLPRLSRGNELLAGDIQACYLLRLGRGLIDQGSGLVRGLYDQATLGGSLGVHRGGRASELNNGVVIKLIDHCRRGVMVLLVNCLVHVGRPVSLVVLRVVTRLKLASRLGTVLVECRR